MSDRIPGTSYSNPIWRGKWRIYLSEGGACPFAYAFSHDDFDGAPDANDSRCGHGHSVDDCKGQIDEHEAEAA